jgi:membrane protease YdiL (CAAX protease family)
MIDTPSSVTPSAEPPSGQRHWSAFGCAGVAILSFSVFVVVQGVVLFDVLFKVHPEALRVFERIFSGMPPPPDFVKTTDRWTTDVATAPYLFLYAVLGDGAMIGVAMLLGKAWLGSSPSALGLTRFARLPQFWIGIGTGIALIFVSNIASGIQAHFFGSHPEKVAELLLTHHGTANFIYDMLSVAVIAPIAEEYLFRGIIFTGLAQRMPVALAIVVSGIVFGAAHLDLWNIFPLAVIGMGLAMLYRRTGSLWPNIIAHATVNTVALVAVYWFPQFAK